VPDVDSTLPERIRQLPRQGAEVPGYRISAPGCDVLFVAAAAGSGVPPHVHETDNVTVIVSGAAVVTTDAGERRYGAGQWYQTSANEEHSVRFDRDTVQVELRFAVESPVAGDRGAE
jgi:quercetin dioxygenase-like cupin family protein